MEKKNKSGKIFTLIGPARLRVSESTGTHRGIQGTEGKGYPYPVEDTEQEC